MTTRFDQNVILNPDDIELRLQRGAEYLSLGAYEAALADFEHAQTLDEKHAETYVGIGQAQYHLLNWPAAESAFLTAISFKENLPDPYFGIGMIYYLQGRYPEAAKEFDRAAEKNPEFAGGRSLVSHRHFSGRRFRERLWPRRIRAFGLAQESAIIHIARSWAYRVQVPPTLSGPRRSPSGTKTGPV